MTPPERNLILVSVCCGQLQLMDIPSGFSQEQFVADFWKGQMIVAFGGLPVGLLLFFVASCFL